MATLEADVARHLEQDEDDRYVMLGVVDVSVRLPPKTGRRTVLYAYLLPDRVEAADWTKQHRSIVSPDSPERHFDGAGPLRRRRPGAAG